MQLSSSLVHWFPWQVTDLDAFKSVGLCPITHSNVTVDPSGKLWVERSSAFKMTFLDAKEGCPHCAEEKNKSQAFNLMYTPVSQLVTGQHSAQWQKVHYLLCKHAMFVLGWIPFYPFVSPLALVPRNRVVSARGENLPIWNETPLGYCYVIIHRR